MTSKHFIKQLLSSRVDNSIAVIAEIKPSTPKGGDLLRGRDPATIARAYQNAGAACLSVVTGKWFGGTPELLEQVASVASLPILRKDLVVNSEQIRQSIALGASAVLLTRKLLAHSQLHRLVDLCIQNRVTPFVEVHEERELDGMELCKEMVLALTNRDISVKETDTDSGLRSLELVEKCRGAGALVSASGIDSHSDACRLVTAGFDGLLVGSSLLKAPDPGEALQTLRGVVGRPESLPNGHSSSTTEPLAM